MFKIALCCFWLILSNCLSGFAQSENESMVRYWHHSLARKLGLTPANLKLYPVQATVLDSSDWLWNAFNALAVYTPDEYYNPSQYNNFSSYYGSLLFQSNFWYPRADTSHYCNQNAAILKYLSAENRYAWDKTIDQLYKEIQLSAPVEIVLDTTMVGLNTSKPAGIIHGNSSPKTRIHIRISSYFDHLLIFYSSPYSRQDSINQLLSTYHPWYTPCIRVGAARENGSYAQRSDIYASSADPRGTSILTACVALVVADGYRIEYQLTSYSKSSLIRTSRHLPLGISKRISRRFTRKNNYYFMSAQASAPAGSLSVLGVVVVPLAYNNNFSTF